MSTNMRAISQIALEDLPRDNSSAANWSEELPKELVAGLQIAVVDEEQRRDILETKGEDAQRWLDTLQLLADSADISSPLRSTILQIMLRLSKKSGCCPKCLVIQNVDKEGEHPVGGGGFGDVWKGTMDHAGSTQTVCLKVVKIYLTSDVRQSLAEYLREAIVWKQLDHPNVLPFLGIYYLDHTRQRICLVSPWMEHGNLVQYLKDTPRESIDHLALALDVASGLSHLHVKKIVHADLKGVNVLIMPSGRACICDFGLSLIADSQAIGLSSSTSRSAGTLRWMAPELLAENVTATKESDIYAFACVCYEILTSLPPFHECKNDGAVIIQVSLGKRPSRPEDLPNSLSVVWDLMEVCWQEDPSLRPSASTILRDYNVGVTTPTGAPIRPALSTLHSPPHPHTPTPSSSPMSPTPTAISRQTASPTPGPLSLLLRIDGVSPIHPLTTLNPNVSNSPSTRDDVALPLSRLREQSRVFAGSSPVVSVAPPLPSNSSDASTIGTMMSTSSATLTDSDDYGDDGTWQKPPTDIVNYRQPSITIKADAVVPVSTTFRWVRGEIIGEGPYGRIYLALNATTGELMVVKQMDIPRPQIRKRTEAAKAFRFESETLKDVDHPNIVQYLGFEESATDLSIFLEYFPSDSVGSVLLEHGKLSESVTTSFAAQILSGLGYLHLKGILHGNLMPENILVDMSGVCKISGWSARTSQYSTERNGTNAPMTPVEDSVFWMAPEMLEPPEKGYDFKADIWSLGCVVLEMLSGTRPWSGFETFVVLDKVFRERTPPPLPEGVVLSELADDFLRQKCFAGNPDERPTASELMEHKYLQPPLGWQFSGFP
ncbi:hypothetical protein PQX77_007952 [Marasmius sp. AFHP31]|nr:hypothetical protein PQX77_007952 [Marasmius sp. AFHP31]